MSLTATAHIYSGVHRSLGILSNVTLVAARVNANAIIQSVGDGAYAVIRDGSHEEVMREITDDESAFRWFPLADIEHVAALEHTPLARLLRHFQMAGAVDQDVIERLAIGMRYTARTGKPWARVRAGSIRFLCNEIEIVAKHLRLGDRIIGWAHGIRNPDGFVVEDVETHWDTVGGPITYRASCNGGNVTFWFGADEPLTIARK